MSRNSKDLDFIDDHFDNHMEILKARIARIKNDALMEEPCPIYEGDAEDWEDFWYNEDTDD